MVSLDGWEVHKAETLGLGGFLAEGMRVFKYLAASGQTRELFRLRDGGRSTSKLKGQCLRFPPPFASRATLSNHPFSSLPSCHAMQLYRYAWAEDFLQPQGRFSLLSR